MVTIAPPLVVVEPPLAAELPHGLFSVISSWGSAENDRWINGISYASHRCGSLGIYGAPQCDFTEVEGLPRVIAEADDCTLVEAESFTVYGWSHGTPVADDHVARAKEHLARGEQAAVEHALWTGAAGNPSNLPADATDLGSSLSPQVGLGVLEGFMGSVIGEQGVIHTSRLGATLFADWLVSDGSQLRTKLGTPVVAGSGYVDEGEVAAYVTGPLMGYRSSVVDYVIFEKGKNEEIALAERTYLISYPECGVGKISLSTTNTSVPPVLSA